MIGRQEACPERCCVLRQAVCKEARERARRNQQQVPLVLPRGSSGAAQCGGARRWR